MGDSNFTMKEKKKFLLKKYIKNHLFEFAVECIINILFVLLIIYLCEGTKYFLGVILAIVYSIGKIINSVKIYKKDWIDIDIR